ncbi:MAG: peroxiredoxin [Flavobacteriales bacterium]|jgi:peroxiredoxin Q/BCP|nr:peroxiredoxin [Flavobacteriales bacterium]
MLKPGDRAPDVELLDQNGHPFLLSSLRGKGPVVLYFYPKDDTPVCTKEACTFRDDHSAFADLGATIIGISKDDSSSHRAFAERYKLPFTLLSDLEDAAFHAFGLQRFLGLKERATFVIDEKGLIRAVISSRLNAGKHVREALAALRDQGLAKS